jgi:hypothetical protein
MTTILRCSPCTCYVRALAVRKDGKGYIFEVAAPKRTQQRWTLRLQAAIEASGLFFPSTIQPAAPQILVTGQAERVVNALRRSAAQFVLTW